jgi:diguanylate cyclase (GGDEF)-like protein/PAS domain S-box-containing protein
VKRSRKSLQSITAGKIDTKGNSDISPNIKSQSKDLEAIINRSSVIVVLKRVAEGWPVDFVSENVGQFGYAAEEFICGGLSFASIIHSEDRKRVEDEVYAFIWEGLEDFTQEYRILTKSGKVRWVEDRTKVRRNSDAVVTHYEGIISDITERRKRDEELNLRAYLLDNVSDSIILHTVEGDLVFVNEAASQSLGYNRVELLKMNILQLGDMENRALYRSRIDEVVENGSASFESKDIRKDGSVRFIEVHSRLVESAGRKLILSTAIDITDRKRAEAELKLKSEELKLNSYILDNVTNSIYVHDLDGNMVFVNDTLCKFLGYTRDELLNLKPFQLSPEKDTKLFRQRMDILVNKGFDVHEVIFVNKLGDEKLVEVHGRVIESEGRQLVLAVLRDITAKKKAEEELKLNADILASTSDSVMVHDFNGTMVYVNETACESLGYTREELMKKNIRQIDVGSPEQSRLKREELMGKGSVVFETTQIRADGTTITVEVNGKIIESKGKKLILGVGRDVTEHKHAEVELRMRSQLLDSATDSIMVHDLEGNIFYVNEAACKLTGYTREELLNLNFHSIHTKSPSGDESKQDEILKRISEKGTVIFESTDIRKDGYLVPVEVHDRIIESEGQKLIIGVIRDITERKQMEEYIKNLAYHDPLTGLPNRTLLYDRFYLAQAHAERYKHILGMMVMDLDKFKDINDTLGHATGDKLLKVIGDRLTECIRKTDTVSRVGGDEFVVLLSEVNSQDDVTGVVEKILEVVRAPVQIDDQMLTITTSVGVALYPKDGRDIDVLIKCADSAMYRAKQLGRNRYENCITDFQG